MNIMNNYRELEDNVSGKYIDFILTDAKKTGKTKLQGEVVGFTIDTIGRWSLEEKKPAVCMICKLALKEGQDIKQCPMCQSMFHHEHIIDWLRMKGICPVCQQNLRPESLDRINL